MTEPISKNTLIDAMDRALTEARKAPLHDDVPVGAVLLDPSGNVVASDHNRREETHDPTAHAEMLVLTQRARDIGDWRLTGHTLVVTLEPCAMCAGAIVLARIARLVYAAYDPKAGAAWSLYNIPQDARLNHRVEMSGGLAATESAELLQEFFAGRRRP